MTSLAVASMMGQTMVINLLLKNHADVNKARDELKSVREERKSWLTDHNAAVAKEMQTGAQSESVADNLTQSLLSKGTITFGGLSQEDFAVKGKSRKSEKKKNMRRIDVNSTRRR